VSAADLGPVTVPLVVSLGAVLALVADVLLPADLKRLVGLGTAAWLLGALLAACWDFPGEAFAGAYVGGPWVSFLQRVVVVAALVAVLGGVDHVARAWPHRQGEYHAILLMSVAGMLLLPGARDLVLFVVAFELMGIPLYVLAALGKTDAPAPTAAPEAALKLYVIGAASSAVTFFGLSLLAAAARGTSFAALASAPAAHPLVAAGLVLAFAGMGFKIGAAPFHAWVPDTYQGAATPFVAFLSVAPKAVGFAALTSVLVLAFGAARAAWLPVVLAACVLTLLVGNLLAIPQSNVKRLLAYSGVAQVGYVLMGLAAGEGRGLAMMLFYLAAYVVTNAGAFLVAHAVAASDGDESVSGFDGLARRSPWLGLSLLVFLLSLAGIPFVAGFWAKLYVFVAAWEAGFGWLVLLGAVLAIVALFYYLGVAKAAYVTAPRRADPVTVGAPLGAAIAACLLAVVLMGLWPRPVLESAERAAAWLVASR
jgi:NADH-quinone oxidoreductase subunit N